MKWGRKKSASLINRVFPVSWLSKLKGKSGGSEDNSASMKQKGKWDLPSPTSLGPASCKNGGFHSMDYDDYWRLSFGDERIQGRRSTGGIHNVLYDSNEDIDVPMKGFPSFDDTILDIKRMKEKQHQVKKSNGRALKEKPAEQGRGRDKPSTLVEKDVHGIGQETGIQTREKNINRSTGSDARQHHRFSIMNSNLRTIEEDCAFRALNGEETNAISVKKSSSECKTRTLQEMKAKTKLKKTKEQVVEVEVLDSFAMVKSSFDPLQDFRESMVEMIREKGIRRPDELEKLLACYLTLNCDEYHDLIIKVFRQVWFDLNPTYMDPAIQNDHCFGGY